MSKGKPPEDLGISDAMRKAGFVKIPAWWVTPDELEVIHRMAHKHSSHITAIRLKSRDRAGRDD